MRAKNRNEKIKSKEFRQLRKRSGRHEVLELSSTHKLRKVSECRSTSSLSWRECGFLTLALLRCAPHLDVAGKSEVRVTVMCSACKEVAIWSNRGLSSAMLLLWSKSLEVLKDEGISITWQMETRPLDAARNGAFAAWPTSTTPFTALEVMRKRFGVMPEDTLTEPELQTQSPLPTT